LGVLLGYGLLHIMRRPVSIDEGHLPILFLYFGILIIAWASSLSEGYNTPILGLSPAFLLIVIGLDGLKITSQPKFRLVTNIACILCIIVVLANYSYLYYKGPYRDLGRQELTYNLADIYPKFGKVYTNEVTYERFQEIAKLKTEYIQDQSTSYIIMPDFPIYYFIAGVRNPVSLDWFIRTGHENPDVDLQIIDELKERKPIVFLEKEYGAPIGDMPKIDEREADKWYTLPYWVSDNWKKIGEGKHFYVYQAFE